MNNIISCIISTCDDPENLLICMASLAIQKTPIQLIVADNSKTRQNETKRICDQFNGDYVSTGLYSCYDAAKRAFDRVKGDWVCFPSSDGYYVPYWSSFMLDTAIKQDLDLVACDCIYDPRLNMRAYSVLYTMPCIGQIDKTCFMLKSILFKDFPPHSQDYRDGALVEELIKGGARYGKAPGIMVVHN